MRDRGDLILTKPIKIEKQVKRDPRRNRATRCLVDSGRASSEIPEWLQEFRENFVDEQRAREAAWKLAKSVLKLKGEKQSNILFTFGKLVFACIKS